MYSRCILYKQIFIFFLNCLNTGPGFICTSEKAIKTEWNWVKHCVLVLFFFILRCRLLRPRKV